MIWIGIAIGMFVGAPLGILLMACIVVGREADEWERMNEGD